MSEAAHKTMLESDVLFSADKSSVLASRFFVQSTRVENAVEEVKMLHSVRAVAAKAPFKAIVYHPFFGFFDQYAEVVQTTVECTIRKAVKYLVCKLVFKLKDMVYVTQ
jgi:hypothetical protein